MKKIRASIFAALISAAAFSLLSINFSFDISILSFPLSAGFTVISVFYLFFKFFIRKNLEIRTITICQKLLQYLPFVLFAAFILRRAGKNGTHYLYDVITVILWCAVFISCQTVLYFFNEKRIGVFIPELKNVKLKNSYKDKKGIVRVFYEIADWIDALLQAVFMVLLIQIFIIQLYVIPSESMVPSFLVKDRVAVFKTKNGPKFPLSEVGIPCLKNYKRGDVIVFRNPHYSMDRKSEVHTVISQIVYMLTFTMLNLNLDESGQPKADPLVKRICGLPGEQLVMQDGILYVRNKSSEVFTPEVSDEKFAAWNLNELPASVKKSIQSIPFSQRHYDIILEIEEKRRNLDLNYAAEIVNKLSESFGNIHNLMGNKSNTQQSYDDISLYEFDLFNKNAFITKKLISSSNGNKWFNSFMASWISDCEKNPLPENDFYEMSNFKLNLMIKLCAGKIILRNAELALDGKKMSEWMQDEQINEYLKEAEKLNFYVMILDQRNMPVFPECTEDGMPVYIPENCYFMMGDNRFNSLDMRHSYSQRLKPLTLHDSYSVQYYSNISPQYVNKKYILGSAVYIFWPLNRCALVRTK